MRFSARCSIPIPQTARTTPAAAGFPEAEEIFVTTRDGERVILWHVPPKADRPVVIFLHGNGEILAWRVPRFRALTADGTGLVALSFRGYGGLDRQADRAGAAEDAAAAYDFAAARYAPARIVPWGYSLGSGVAVALATTRPVGGLVLEAPYTSTVDVAAGAFPIFPVRWLMRDRFHSDRRIGCAEGAAAGDARRKGQRSLPIAFGRRLYELAPEPKRFVAFEDGTHVDLDEQERSGAVARPSCRRDRAAGANRRVRTKEKRGPEARVFIQTICCRLTGAEAARTCTGTAAASAGTTGPPRVSVFGFIGSRPSRCSFLRASLRARRTASAFSRAFFSEGFS